MKEKSLNQKILEYLQEGNTISSLEALNLFNCMSLAARILNIRKRYLKPGETIIGVTETNNNKHYTRYYYKNC